MVPTTAMPIQPPEPAPRLSAEHSAAEPGAISINRGLSAADRLATLRHELVHRAVVRNPMLGPASRFLYARSAAWTYAEEAIAEVRGTGSLIQGLAFPITSGFYLRWPMVRFDAGVLIGAGIVGFGVSGGFR